MNGLPARRCRRGVRPQDQPVVQAGINVAAARRGERNLRQWLLHLLFGGEGNPEHLDGIHPDHDYYNPVTDSWHRLENMPIAVHGVTGMSFIKGLIHLPGGGTTVGGSTGSVIHRVYKPTMSCR